jgi:cystathionine gamma-lyase/cystathionine beta-lyase/cystathionine gamma-lyase/homocysteine desulfhydrase
LSDNEKKPGEAEREGARQPKGFATRAIHDGQRADPRTGAVNVPLYLTSTFQMDGIEEHRGWEYSRVSNPTRDALEESLASLEGGKSAHVFASGVAATAALCTMMRSGDHVVCSANVYGGTARLLDQVFPRYGITVTYADSSDPAKVAAAIRPETKLVHVETPTNPMMVLTDVRAVAEVAHARGVEVSVDNTFMSPYLQRPLELGADIVMHSTTKFLNGHSDGLGGVLVCSTQEQAERFRFVQKSTGGILSPFEAFLLLRGVKTLAVRMRQHDANGRAVAGFLAERLGAERVFYPGLETHPQHQLAKRQQRGFGSMLSIELGTRERANGFVKRLRLAMLAASLGGVETLVCHPATMTHADMSAEERARMGIGEGLIRISVGLEEVEDVIADLGQALEVAERKQQR